MASRMAARVAKVSGVHGNVLEVPGDAAISPEPGACTQPAGDGRPTMPFMSPLRSMV